MTMLKMYPKGEHHILKEDEELGASDSPWGQFYWTHVLEGLSNMMNLYKEKIQLIYIDPPFMTGQLFRYRRNIGEKGIIEHVAYNDQWREGKKDFLPFMRQVFEYVYELLTPEGSFYVHVDYRTSAYLRVILDEVFGEDNFLNEIIWHYQSGGRAKRHFSRKHDTILFYRKSLKHYFNIDAIGMERGDKKRNNMKRGVDEEGKVFWSIKSSGKVYRYYEDSKVYPSDVWTDISHLHQRDPERTGYDTQKPEALLERIILASSKPGDYVADFFAGSGTTLAVAKRLKRKWIGMDSSPHSMHVSRKRLLALVDREDFTIYYGDNDKSLFEPKISIEYNRNFDSTNTITLLDYIPCDNMKISFKDEKNMELEGLEHIDYWAVGYIKGGLFCPKARIIKDDTSSIIKNSIKIDEPIGEDLVVHIIDIWGNQFFRELPSLINRSLC